MARTLSRPEEFLPVQFAPIRGMMEALNAGGALLIFFLAYVSLGRGRDVLGTGLGKDVKPDEAEAVQGA